MTIHYIDGDATEPQGEGSKIIAHVVNDLGRWGSGFVVALSQRWKAPEAAYLEWADKPLRLPINMDNLLYFQEGEFALGNVQFVRVKASPQMWVANMVGQRGVRRLGSDYVPVRYDAIRSALEKVAEEARALEATVHMPRIGCGLAGGTWSEIEPILVRTLHDLEVFVYDPPGNQFNA